MLNPSKAIDLFHWFHQRLLTLKPPASPKFSQKKEKPKLLSFIVKS